jgi:hypothetical protein
MNVPSCQLLQAQNTLGFISRVIMDRIEDHVLTQLHGCGIFSQRIRSKSNNAFAFFRVTP